MAVSSAKDARAVKIVNPDDGLDFAGAFACGGGERSGAGPDFFDDVEFVLGRGPIFGKVFHDGMILGDDFDGVFGLVLVMLAGDAEEFAPVIDLSGAVGVHGAVDDHGGFTGFVGVGDAADVIVVGGVSEAFIVNDDVVWLGPIFIFVELDLGAGAGAAFVDDGEFDVSDLGDGFGQGFGLELVVVAAAASDDEAFKRLAGIEFVGSADCEHGGESDGGEEPDE